MSMGALKRSLVLPTAVAALVLGVALALGSGTGRGGGGATAAVVRGHTARDVIRSYAYQPETLTVTVGTRVRWTNRDQTAHTATADGGAFDTGTIQPGQTKSVKLTRTGTFAYHCAFHAFMSGTIKVVR